MINSRLIFTLLLQDGIYQLSRNFRLQAVGNLEWIKENYDFHAIASSIDELIVLNVSRYTKECQPFAEAIDDLVKYCFMPVAVGGGISSIADAHRIFHAGADKLVVNTALFQNPTLVKELVKYFGSQAIVASIDYKEVNKNKNVFISNGKIDTGIILLEAIEYVQTLNVGEIYLTSIDRDGTGQGYDLETLSQIERHVQVPLIASGGVGRYDHLVSGIVDAGVQAVATSNLFNFMADGLIEARRFMGEAGIDLASWRAVY